MRAAPMIFRMLELRSWRTIDGEHCFQRKLGIYSTSRVASPPYRSMYILPTTTPGAAGQSSVSRWRHANILAYIGLFVSLNAVFKRKIDGTRKFTILRAKWIICPLHCPLHATDIHPVPATDYPRYLFTSENLSLAHAKIGKGLVHTQNSTHG